MLDKIWLHLSVEEKHARLEDVDLTIWQQFSKLNVSIRFPSRGLEQQASSNYLL